MSVAKKKTTIIFDETTLKQIKILSALEDESMVSFIRKAVEERIVKMTNPANKEAILNLIAFSESQTQTYSGNDDQLLEEASDEVRKYRMEQKG